MKFITKKGAPDIPLELLEARDDGRLVFFCGAGISRQAGIAGFGGLIDQIYESLPDQMNEQEAKAYREEHYDRVLELLEHRYYSRRRADKFLIRKKINQHLSIPKRANLSTHKAILELAKTKNGRVRLVTTNVDQGFILADPSLKPFIDSAPKLPVPKPHKWYSLVHLHGIIDDRVNPDGEHFVFTSGDFGTAYLTERWASRFVGELFRNFIVLFVGYSVKDPVIRYMTDAIAAERRKGDNRFFRPYVFAASSFAAREKDKKSWRVKGIEPILYHAGRKHTYLHNTLKRWATYCREGLRGKEQIIRLYSTIGPRSPFDDETTRLVLETLRERTDGNEKNLTGRPAKIFADLEPVPPIDWLPAFEEKKLLNQFQAPEQCFPLPFHQTFSNLVKPNSVSRHLWYWLARHLDKKELVEWCIDHGSYLHPDFSEIINSKLTGSEAPPEPYLTFWKIVTSGQVKRQHDEDRVWDLPKILRQNPIKLDLHFFLSLIQPKIKLSKPFRLPVDLASEEENNLFEAEVVLSMEDRYIYESIYTLEQYPALFVPILFELGMALKKAMELQEIIGNASYWHDRSHWDMPSISPHAQNQRFHNWVILIGLCRDVWQAAWQHDKKMAIAVLETWKVIRFPVFRRLLFHAYTVGDVVMPSQMLDELLADDNWWLWVVDVGREKYRLLHTIWPVLDSCDSERLIDVVMAGPPRKMFQDDLSDSEWRDCRSRAIWKLLAMLASFGRPLPFAAQKIFEQISAEYPMWRLRGDDQDEFSHWMYETTWGPNSDISLDNLISLQPDELVKKLLENNPEKHEGRISVFRTLCKENSSKAYNILEWLTNNNLWHDELWHAALVGLADGKDSQFLPVAKWLSSAPAELFKNEAWSIAWWVKATSDRYEPDSEEEHFFWLIFNALLENAPQNDFSRDDDVLSSAINDPFGMITEALISRFGCRKIDRNKGIPTGPLMKSVSQVMDGNGAGFILARVILASRLHYFHAIAPEWARKNIIQKMAWGESNEASYLWQGYLGGARISADLLLDLKVYFLQTISHIEELYSSSRERFFQLIAIILLQSTDAFSKIEKIELLRKVGHEGRREIVSVFLQSFQGNGKKEKNELFWSNHLKPLFKWVWPKDATSIDETTSQYLTLLAVKTGGKFPEAIDIFQQIIGPFSELRSLITALNNSSLPQNYPKEVIRLFEMVFTEQYQYPTENFRKVLNKIIEANPALAKNETYRRIDYFLQGKNL